MFGFLTGAWGVISRMGLSQWVGKGVMAAGTYIKTRWRFILKYWYFFVIAGLVGGWWLDHHLAGKLQDQTELELTSARGILAAVEPTLRQNRAAMEQCLDTNRKNWQAYVDLQEQYAVAQEQIEASNEVAEAEIEEIGDEITQLRGQDVECRRLDDPLPVWFDNWLREPTGNPHRVSDGGSDPAGVRPGS